MLDAIAGAAGDDLLDLHRDPHHHRAVLTLVGEDAPRAVAAEAVARLDLRHHDGVHPRLGVVDVVPFVPLGSGTMADAVAARDGFAAWAGAELGVPSFLYGPGERRPTCPSCGGRRGRAPSPDRGAGPAPPNGGSGVRGRPGPARGLQRLAGRAGPRAGAAGGGGHPSPGIRAARAGRGRRGRR